MIKTHDPSVIKRDPYKRRRDPDIETLTQIAASDGVLDRRESSIEVEELELNLDPSSTEFGSFLPSENPVNQRQSRKARGDSFYYTSHKKVFLIDEEQQERKESEQGKVSSI